LNQGSALIGKGAADIIGEFSVPISSIIEFYQKPQYFNIINYEGVLQGQILARFYLKQVDVKSKKKDDFKQIERQFEDIG